MALMVDKGTKSLSPCLGNCFALSAAYYPLKIKRTKDLSQRGFAVNGFVIEGERSSV